MISEDQTSLLLVKRTLYAKFLFFANTCLLVNSSSSSNPYARLAYGEILIISEQMQWSGERRYDDLKIQIC